MNRIAHDMDKPLAQEGYALMGAAFEVHREPGGGLLEEIYQQNQFRADRQSAVETFRIVSICKGARARPGR